MTSIDARDLDTLEMLSPRELQVLDLIVDGLSNAEIAATLYVTVNTVKTFIRSAYRKIGVERRSQAAAWAFLRGFGTREAA